MAFELFSAIWGVLRGPVLFASAFLNDTLFVAAFTILFVLALSLFFREEKRLPFLVCAVAIALLLGFGFKLFLQEERPCVEKPGKIACPTDFSLPSLHALLVFTLVVVSVGSRSFAPYLIYALFVSFSRVYLGVHTIPQVMAGLALAFFACVFTEMIWRAMRLKIPSEVRLQHDINRLQG